MGRQCSPRAGLNCQESTLRTIPDCLRVRPERSSTSPKSLTRHDVHWSDTLRRSRPAGFRALRPFRRPSRQRFSTCNDDEGRRRDQARLIPHCRASSRPVSLTGRPCRARGASGLHDITAMYSRAILRTCASSIAMTWSKHSLRKLPTQRSAMPFCQGLRMAVWTGLMPDERSRLDISALNFASWSRMAYW